MRISDWSSDVCSSDLVEPAPQRADQLRADAHLALHLGRAQVEVAVPEADILAGVLVGVERQRLGLVEHLDRGRDHFHLAGGNLRIRRLARSEDHTSELKSLMRISYAVFCLKKKT